MPEEVTTSNLKTALQTMFDMSGGEFYKEGTNEELLIVMPNEEKHPRKWLNNTILINMIAVTCTIIIVFSAFSNLIIRFLFIEPILDLKIYPAYNLAPSAILFLGFTALNSFLLIFAGMKLHSAFFIWCAGYLIIQFGLLLKTTYKFPIKFNYYHLFHNMKTIVGLPHDWKIFLMKTVLGVANTKTIFSSLIESDKQHFAFYAILIFLNICGSCFVIRGYI